MYVSAILKDFPLMRQGRRLAQLLGVKPGPAIGAMLERVIEWQLEEKGRSLQECEQWITDVLKNDVDYGALEAMNAKKLKK